MIVCYKKPSGITITTEAQRSDGKGLRLPVDRCGVTVTRPFDSEPDTLLVTRNPPAQASAGMSRLRVGAVTAWADSRPLDYGTSVTLDIAATQVWAYLLPAGRARDVPETRQ